MLHEKLLRVLLLFHIVLQIHADWSENINQIAESMLYLLDASHYEGWDVTSFDTEKQKLVCRLGTEDPPSLFPNLATKIVTTSISVDLQGFHGDIPLIVKPSTLSGNASSSTIDHPFNTRISQPISVIHCGHDANNTQYYFGKGPEVNSVVVYCKVAYGEIATLVGKFYNLDPYILLS